MKNKKGQLMQLPINLLMLFITIAFLIALIPGLMELINNAQQSDSLNCKGYSVNGNPNDPLSFNSSLATSTMSCLAIKLYVPYIVLGVLIAGVAYIFYGRTMGGGGGQQYG